jgi:20S proteasome alpha/beta subunit
MTTIAYNHKDKQVAVDSRMTSNEIINTDTCDKFIENDLGIWVFAGSDCDFKALSKLSHGDSSSDLGCIAMLITKGKVYGVETDGGICTHTEYPHHKAFGSGSHFALASMDHGKSAEDAVKYAMTRDIYTGGTVNVFDV